MRGGGKLGTMSGIIEAVSMIPTVTSCISCSKAAAALDAMGDGIRGVEFSTWTSLQ